MPFKWNLGWVYIVKANDLYKIGSAKRSHKRIAQLRTASPFLEEVHHIHCFEYRQVEKWLHRMFRKKRVVGEWFSLTESDLDHIAGLDLDTFAPEHFARERALKAYDEYKAQRETGPSRLELIKAEMARTGNVDG